MTTIVALYHKDEGYSIAADGRLSTDQNVIISDTAEKIIYANGMHIGIAGSQAAAPAIKEFFLLSDEFAALPEVADTASAITLLRELCCAVNEHTDTHICPVNDDDKRPYWEVLIASTYGLFVLSSNGVVVGGRAVGTSMQYIGIGTGAVAAMALVHVAAMRANAAIEISKITNDQPTSDASIFAYDMRKVIDTAATFDAATGGWTRVFNRKFNDALPHQEEASLGSATIN